MARDVQEENIYERKTKGRLPVKWTAYESLLYGQYTTKSNVWSYGVVLYEISTIGKCFIIQSLTEVLGWILEVCVLCAFHAAGSRRIIYH